MQARCDISKGLLDMEYHLSSHSYLIRDRMSKADICLFPLCVALRQFGVLDFSHFPSLFRWFNTMAHLSVVIASIGSFAHLSTVKVVKEGQTEGKWSRHRTRVRDLLAAGVTAIGDEVHLKGWIRTSRSAEKGSMLFVELNDGSCHKCVQLIFSAASSVGMENVANAGGVHAAISITGEVVASPAKGQAIEVTVKNAAVLGPIYGGENGEIGAKNYPMSKKQHSLEFLREKVGLIFI